MHNNSIAHNWLLDIKRLFGRQDDEKSELAGDAVQSDKSAKDESAKDESAKDESAKDESAKDESAKDESAKDESAKDESAKDESAKDESAKDESAKDESAKDEDPPIDHTLALTVADEINRMQTRLYILEDQGVKVTPLLKALERLEVQLSLQGYEIVDHKNRPYVEGMTAYPQFEEDNDLGDGEQIISGIIKPQVNFNGKLLQVPEIRVSFGG
jgi:hypothetical protein